MSKRRTVAMAGCQALMRLDVLAPSRASSLLQCLRSYTKSAFTEKPVGASLLAMVVNDDAGCLDACGVWDTIASKLAPTVSEVVHKICVHRETL